MKKNKGSSTWFFDPRWRRRKLEGKFMCEILEGKIWNGIVYDNNGNFLGRWFNGKLQK